MKRITSIIVIMILCLSLLSMNVFAASPAASAAGPQEVEKGQTVQVQLKLTADNVYGVSGKINYDASLLELESVQGGNNNLAVALNNNNNKFTVYHIMGELLVENTGTIVVLNFKVLDDAAGSVVFSDLIATDGTADIAVSNATYSFTIAEPVPEETEPEETQPEETEPKPTEPKPTEPKPTEPKPTEPKPTEPKPTEPKPTEPKPTEPEATEPSTEVTEPSQEGTEPSQPEVQPTEPGTADGEGEQKCNWWWILIVIVILLCIWHLIVILRKKKREEQDA